MTTCNTLYRLCLGLGNHSHQAFLIVYSNYIIIRSNLSAMHDAKIKQAKKSKFLIESRTSRISSFKAEMVCLHATHLIKKNHISFAWIYFPRKQSNLYV